LEASLAVRDDVIGQLSPGLWIQSATRVLWTAGGPSADQANVG